MKIVRISSEGVFPVSAVKMESERGFYYCILHGVHEDGGWQARLPLGVRDFPCDEHSPPFLDLDGDYGTIQLPGVDRERNQGRMLVLGQPDGSSLALLDTEYRKGVGDLRWEAQGRTQMLFAGWSPPALFPTRYRSPCPAILVAGPSASIAWNWTNQLKTWHAIYDRGQWDVREQEFAMRRSAHT